MRSGLSVLCHLPQQSLKHLINIIKKEQKDKENLRRVITIGHFGWCLTGLNIRKDGLGLVFTGVTVVLFCCVSTVQYTYLSAERKHRQ